MSSDESYASPSPQRRRKRKVWPSSSEESVDAGSPIIRPRRCRRQQTFNPIPDEDSSDSDGSIIQVKRKKVARVRSDSEQSSSSDSVIFNIKKNVAPIEDSDDNYISDSQWETDFTDNETQNKINIEKPSSSVADEKVIDSDSSDGQSEKCPICLASFRLQKIGVPESCDHSFCLECIQEWSKNMNTCPVDRKEYNSISIKKSIEGVVLRKVAVDKPQTQNEVDIVEDLTYCEICGSSDNEERLLLCDGCDFGFHMYCLTPALQEVPAGRWYCNGCSPLMNPGQRRAPQARLPRTTQIERVRRRIANNRRPTDVNESRPSTSSGRSRSSRNLTASTSRPRKSTKKRRRTKISYRTVYEIDEVTGEAVAVKKRVKAKKKNTRRKRKPKQTQGSKKSRGGCRPGTSSSNVIEHHRHNAGIPSLDLFGTANRLDYFSESEEDYNNTAEHGILITLAAGFRSEASRLRRVARRKALMVDGPSAAVSSSSDILGSIMDTQEKFLAKNSVLTVVDSSGKLDIQQKNQCNAVTSTSLPIQAIHEENNNNKVDINSSDAPVRETPYGGRRGGNPNRNRYSNRGGGYNNSTSHNNYNRRYDNAPSHSSNSGGGPLDFSRDNFDDNMGGFGRGRPLLRDGDFNMPQDYTQRTLERENFNRPPRRDERDDRNFFPRFPPRDDFRMPLDGDGDGPGFPPRDNFRMPLDRDRDGPGFPPRDNFRMPLDRDRDGPGFPPRFHDDFPRNRRGNRGRDNSMYSPPRHENSFKRNEDYTPGPPNFPRDPPADFSTGPPNFAPEHPIDFTPGPEPDFSSAPPTNFGHERGGPEPLPALGAIRPEIPSLLELGPPPSLGFGPPPLLGLRLPPILDSGPPPVESSTFPTGPPPGFAENFPRPLLGSPPVEPSTFPAGPPPGFAENFPRPLLGSPPVEPSTFPAGPPPGFAENFPRPLLGSPPVEPSTFPVGPPPGFAENFPRPLLGSPPVEPSTFPGGPPPGFTENFPPPLLGLPPVEPPTFPAGLPPGFIENFPPPLLGLKLPSNLESAPSTQTFSSEPDFSFSHVENSEPDFTSDSPPRQFTTNLQSDSTAGQFNVGASFQSDSTPAEFNLGADFQSESTADQFNVVGANFQSDSTTGQANHDADFQSDSSPGQFKSGGDFQSDSTPCELNDSNLQNAAEDIPLPETYMPEEAYMPESDEVPQSQDDSVRYSPKDDSEEYNPENCTDQYNPEDYPDEYNPEECTQGSDPEVDIYGDMGEEAAKTVDNSEGNMLPPPEPPMSLLGDHRPLTPSSVPYTPSRPLSPGSYSPKRPYSPPRSYSPSFPTSPPRSLPNDVPYTPSRPFTPNRTPERPNNATAQVDSPAGNTDGDSENDMVIDTDKGQEEQKDDSTPNISNENPIASQENQENIQSQEDISTDAQVPENVNEGETEKNDETWEKDSDNGDSKLGENMWEETPSVHKKPQSNNWEETPVPRINNNWEETPALRVKPPPKSNWDREEDELGDGCPNFSIYSRQSKSVALTTDITISQTKESIKNWDSHTPPKKSSSKVETTFGYGSDPRVKILTNTRILSGLYSDSEDESVVKKTSILDKPKDGEPDNHMTEEIVSEEERSYTPCRDENSAKQGLEGLDTEMVSEDERNEFENGTADGDALEINAKDTELDFTRPEDCEEGEIPDTNGGKSQDIQEEVAASKEKIKKKKKEKTKDVSNEKEKSNKENVPKEFFKKISRSNKDRNYRGDRGRSRSPRSKEKRKTSKEKWRENKKKKDKRREIERYDVRAIISEKPDRPKKDGFGRDIPGNSRSRSYTPPLVKSLFVRRSVTPKRRTRSPSPRRRPNRERSRSRQKSGGRKIDKSKPSRSKLSRSKSRSRKKDKSKTKKRKRSASKSEKRREGKGKKRVRARSQTPLSPQQQQPIAPRDWTPSLSPSPAPMRIASPSWTPPREETRLEDLRNAVNQSLQVLLNNTTSGGKSKRDKRRKEKRRDRTSRRRRERTPPPSKEVFASGDNILVSVSFNNENESRDVREKRREEQRKKKNKRKDKNKEIAGVKPVAIIDLERSPFMEVPSSPKEIIVLSDSDQQDAEASNIETACDSSQQVASPETRNVYSMGPKTPPEPQVKFSLSTKPSQLRVINNPLHDPDDEIQTEPQEEVNTSIHKGPNTPPEPPTSPPSSPDAYDPFEPTKSRSPSPQPSQTIQSNVVDESNTTNVDSSSIDIAEKINQTPEVMKPSTPPISEVQPADSQCSIVVASELKSPDTRLISNVVSQVVQATVTSVKPVAQTIPFSSVPTSSMITSTPIQSTITTQRINILNSTVITPQIPQRIVLPNQVKSSPVKISPTKAAIKSTPIKPMAKAGKITKKVSRVLNGSSTDEVTVDVDSPYSPASSDYEDLFEPPPEILKAPKSTSKIQQSHKSVFDTLFGSPSMRKKIKPGSAKKSSSKTKHIGVKIDEDSLKILEDLPNSAVEMQVKDKFLKKLNRQERVVEEVKMVLKPFYNRKKITKDEYKDIMRRAVPKICHNKSGEINPNKIRKLVEAYVKKISHSKKVTSSSSLLPLLK